MDQVLSLKYSMIYWTTNIQEDLNIIELWCKDNNMLIYCSKTKCMTVGTKQKLTIMDQVLSLKYSMIYWTFIRKSISNLYLCSICHIKIKKSKSFFLLNPYISSFLAMISWSTTSKAFSNFYVRGKMYLYKLQTSICTIRYIQSNWNTYLKTYVSALGKIQSSTWCLIWFLFVI
jgi:hypothetical protein